MKGVTRSSPTLEGLCVSHWRRACFFRSTTKTRRHIVWSFQYASTCSFTASVASFGPADLPNLSRWRTGRGSTSVRLARGAVSPGQIRLASDNTRASLQQACDYYWTLGPNARDPSVRHLWNIEASSNDMEASSNDVQRLKTFHLLAPRIYDFSSINHFTDRKLQNSAISQSK